MEIDNPSRSPSPAAPPPTTSAPGPRATALQKLYNDCTAHVLRTCSYANFSSCFPTPSKEVPQSIRNLHEEFTQKLGESLRREFEGILEDRGVVGSLNELDRLVEDARRRKKRAEEQAEREGEGQGGEGVKRPVPPHTLPARQLYISHLAPSLGSYSKQLGERQAGLAGENAVLAERILEQRRNIAALIGGLEGVVRDLAGSVDVLTGGGTQEGEEELEKVREMVREVERQAREAQRE